MTAYKIAREEKVVSMKEADLMELRSSVTAKGIFGKVDQYPDESDYAHMLRLQE